MNELTQKKSANFDLSAIDFLELTDPFYGNEKPAEKEGEKYIVFFLDAEIYGVPAKHVLEIFQPLAITSLPNFPEWLLGIANFRSEVISVIDLQKLWNKDSTLFAPKPKLVVLRPAKSQPPVAFIVDRISELVTLPDAGIQPLTEKDAPYIYGRAQHKSNNLRLLDTQKLLATLSL